MGAVCTSGSRTSVQPNGAPQALVVNPLPTYNDHNVHPAERSVEHVRYSRGPRERHR